jgi:DNA-binding response OmpR family regulator
MLSNNPWRIECAHTAREALQLAAERPFDLYILGNWWLEDGVRGIELSLDLRHKDPSTPVLFYSSNASPKEVQAGLATGAVGYIVKPDVQGLLELKIHAILASSESRSHEARMEAIRVTIEEIADHLTRTDLATDAAANMARASTSPANASDLLVRSRAKIAFYKAGGNRACFERMWPAVLEEAIRLAS